MAQKNTVKSPASKTAASKTTASKTTASKTANKAPSKQAKAVKPVTREPAAKAAVKPVVPAAKKTASAQVKEKELIQAKEKIKKPKLVRDSFTMPEEEYSVLNDVKKACIKGGFEVKKSELLRVGVALIRNMDLAALKNVLATLPPLKAGRPKGEK